MKKSLSVALFLCLLAPTSYAMPFGVSQDVADKASQSTAWHRLLLYKNGKSDVRHEPFFLTKDGTPKAEMMAVLSAWEQGDDVACRFPARLHFLKNTLAIDKPLPACPKFDDWKKQSNINKLSLIFANEHPSNLASGFGHTLIKADKVDGEPIAINYTPNYPKTEKPAVGAYRSLTGYYMGVMEVVPFAPRKQEYWDNERDLWQFELDLTQGDIDQIVRHLWEVKDTARSYYLTNDNCATEIVRLLDVVRPNGELADKLGKITTPAQIAQVLDKAKFIKKSTHLPAPKSKQSPQGNPLNRSPMHRLGVSYAHSATSDTRVGLSYRTAYRDVLDRPLGVRSFLDLQILGLDVAYDDKLRLDKLTVISQRHYETPNSPSPKNTNRAGGQHLGIKRVYGKDGNALVGYATLEKGLSWQSQDTSTLCYGLGAGSAQIGKVDKGYRLGVGASVGCVREFSDTVRAKAEVNVPYWFGVGRDGVADGFVPQVNVGVQYDLDRHNAVRLTWQKDKYEQAGQVAYQRYF